MQSTAHLENGADGRVNLAGVYAAIRGNVLEPGLADRLERRAAANTRVLSGIDVNRVLIGVTMIMDAIGALDHELGHRESDSLIGMYGVLGGDILIPSMNDFLACSSRPGLTLMATGDVNRTLLATLMIIDAIGCFERATGECDPPARRIRLDS